MARVLDLTRSMRRAGRIATGIDRVERAYLDRFLQDDDVVFGLFRSALGYLLLDREGLVAFQAHLAEPSGQAKTDRISRLVPGRDQAQTRAESHIRALCLDRSLPALLPRMLRRHVAEPFEYFNVGHSNLTDRVFAAVKQAGGSAHVFLHDVIPLEFPQFQRPDRIVPFEKMIGRVSACADRVIFNSAETERRAAGYLARAGRVPPSVVAHLGVNVPQAGAVERGLLPERPYFVTVGTIEPRKNHDFLLDLWETMGPEAPPLLICGNRGWQNEAVFERLDNLPKDSAIVELNGLDDGTLWGLVGQAAGAVFPTVAEGFCLPAVEAQMLGTGVLCNDLPVLHEVLGENAQFVPVYRKDLWLESIWGWKECGPLRGSVGDHYGRSWDAHFKTVLRLI